MKYRFNTFDIICGITELQSLIGYRVNQIYDVDHRTYLIRLAGGSDQQKTVLLLESGIRFHTTAFEWPKGMVPSGFSMKLRKHLKNKRLERVDQLGVDRIVFFQFGIGEAAYYIILELYDKGNIILTDHEFTILHLLWPHTIGNNEIRYAIHEKYPMNRVKIIAPEIPELDKLRVILSEKTKPGDNLRGILMDLTCCGPTVIQHVLITHNLDTCFIPQKKCDDNDNDKEKKEEVEETKFNSPSKQKRKMMKKYIRNMGKGRPFDYDQDLPTLLVALKDCQKMVNNARKTVSKGYIVKKKEQRPSVDSKNVENFYQNIEFISYLFVQFHDQMIDKFETFMLAVDEFYSKMEGQKIDMKTMIQQREALKKLSNVRDDHIKRVQQLTEAQFIDKRKAELIIANQDVVQHVIMVIQTAIASQKSWRDMEHLIELAKMSNDPLINKLHSFDLKRNVITLNLQDDDDDYDYDDDDDDEKVKQQQQDDDDDDDDDDESCDDNESDENNKDTTNKNNKNNKNKNKRSSSGKDNHHKKDNIHLVEIDLCLTAMANARNYYDQKKAASKKVQKTIDASHKALISAEKKTEKSLKEASRISNIYKARKVYWFEKFYWFISSENYLVIGGRDATQNEMIVKRYMRKNDIYVHAEVQGASSVVIRNPLSGVVPPKTLLEAGTMAISYSVTWDLKVATNAYWVYSHQVSKQAPSGEYLTTGSFMIRGKKNFLPLCQMTMGIGLLFKLEDSFVDGHRDERKSRNIAQENADGEEEEDDHLLDKSIKIPKDCPVLTFTSEKSNEDFSGMEGVLRLKLDGNRSKNSSLNTIDENDLERSLEERAEKNFPDTEIKIDHNTGRIMFRRSQAQNVGIANYLINSVNSSPRSISLIKNPAYQTEKAKEEEEETTIIGSKPARQKQQQQQQNSRKKKKEEKKNAHKNKIQQAIQNRKLPEEEEEMSPVLIRKRAQKGKLRKMKEKYKDQTEQEQKQRIQILQKENALNMFMMPTPTSMNGNVVNTVNTNIFRAVITSCTFESNDVEEEDTAKDNNNGQNNNEPADDDEGMQLTGTDDETAIINSLTGKPFEGDELLFAIPVVAPYSSILNYKYKVKITPGTEKRGKAAKKALQVFLIDKQCSLHEKDLMKSIKDDIMARNIPGKVKIAAPQLIKNKK